MGKFISTTFGYISGRHGTAVAAVTKDGKNILRVYKSPSNPNTPKQQAHLFISPQKYTSISIQKYTILN